MLKDFSYKKIKHPQRALLALGEFFVPKMQWNDASIQLGDTPYLTDETFSAALRNLTASNIGNFALFCPSINDGASIGIPNFLHWKKQAPHSDQERISPIVSYIDSKKTFGQILTHYETLQKLYDTLFCGIHIPLSLLIAEKSIPDIKIIAQADLENIAIQALTQFLERNDRTSIGLQFDITDEKFDRIAYFLDITSHFYCIVSIPDSLGEYTQKKLLQLLQKHPSRVLLQSGSSLTRSMHLPQYASRIQQFLQELDPYFRDTFFIQNFKKFYL